MGEKSLSHYLLKNIINCNNIADQETPTTVVVGIDSTPSDTILIDETYCNIKACCSPNCSLVSGSITIKQAHYNSHNPLANLNQCHFFETIVEYMRKLNFGDIMGLDNIYFIGIEGISIDTHFQRIDCPGLSFMSESVSEIITLETLDVGNNSLYDILLPSMSLLAIVGLIYVYKVRQNKKKKRNLIIIC